MNRLVLFFLILISSFLSDCTFNKNKEENKTLHTIEKSDTIQEIKIPAPNIEDSFNSIQLSIENEVEFAGLSNPMKQKIEVENTGLVRFKVQDTMEVGVFSSVNVRISEKKDTAKISLSMPDGSTILTSIGSSMSARLLDPDVNFFLITNLSSETQTVENDADFTSWEWSVKPLKEGKHKLKLLLTIKEQDFVKDIPIFEKNIIVRTSTSYSIINFINNNWQTLLPTIFIPTIGFLWHLFFRKKRKYTDDED